MKNLKTFKFIGFIFILLTSSLSMAQNETAQHLGQQKMEDALKGIHTIEDLLNDETKLNNYYQAANEYYQSKIPKARFNIIIKQITKMNQENPELGFRLLNQQNKLRPYEIVSDLKTYGLDIDHMNWDIEEKKYFGSKKDSLTNIKSDLKN